MPETSKIFGGQAPWIRACAASLGLLAGACVAPEAAKPPEPVALPTPRPEPEPAPKPDTSADEARALLAQAETDIQRARARRALWTTAWEALVAARKAAAIGDHPATIRHARRASEQAQSGLEQLAYPAVR